MSKPNARTRSARQGKRQTSLTGRSSPGIGKSICAALCHAGPGNLKAPAFSFVPGANLAKYVAIPDDPADTPIAMVHMLTRCNCWKSSRYFVVQHHDLHHLP